MAVTPALIARIAPQLASLPAEVMQPWIDDAEAEVDRSVFASEHVADLAVAYYTAHMMALSEPAAQAAGAGRLVASVSVGPVSSSFVAASAEFAGELGQTRYGQRYLTLIASAGVARLL